jgi:hypothetical protein
MGNVFTFQPRRKREELEIMRDVINWLLMETKEEIEKLNGNVIVTYDDVTSVITINILIVNQIPECVQLKMLKIEEPYTSDLNTRTTIVWLKINGLEFYGSKTGAYPLLYGEESSKDFLVKELFSSLFDENCVRHGFIPSKSAVF